MYLLTWCGSDLCRVFVSGSMRRGGGGVFVKKRELWTVKDTCVCETVCVWRRGHGESPWTGRQFASAAEHPPHRPSSQMSSFSKTSPYLGEFWIWLSFSATKWTKKRKRRLVGCELLNFSSTFLFQPWRWGAHAASHPTFGFKFVSRRNLNRLLAWRKTFQTFRLFATDGYFSLFPFFSLHCWCHNDGHYWGCRYRLRLMSQKQHIPLFLPPHNALVSSKVHFAKRLSCKDSFHVVRQTHTCSEICFFASNISGSSSRRRKYTKGK